jgi:hypothetical protein
MRTIVAVVVVVVIAIQRDKSLFIYQCVTSLINTATQQAMTTIEFNTQDSTTQFFINKRTRVASDTNEHMKEIISIKFVLLAQAMNKCDTTIVAVCQFR